MITIMSQVIGVPDDRLGEEICAWIKLKDNIECTEHEIKDFCKGKVNRLCFRLKKCQLCAGLMPFVSLSVRQSVRPSVRHFFFHLNEAIRISITLDHYNFTSCKSNSI